MNSPGFVIISLEVHATGCLTTGKLTRERPEWIIPLKKTEKV